MRKAKKNKPKGGRIQTKVKNAEFISETNLIHQHHQTHSAMAQDVCLHVCLSSVWKWKFEELFLSTRFKLERVETRVRLMLLADVSAISHTGCFRSDLHSLPRTWACAIPGTTQTKQSSHQWTVRNVASRCVYVVWLRCQYANEHAGRPC